MGGHWVLFSWRPGGKPPAPPATPSPGQFASAQDASPHQRRNSQVQSGEGALGPQSPGAGRRLWVPPAQERGGRLWVPPAQEPGGASGSPQPRSGEDASAPPQPRSGEAPPGPPPVARALQQRGSEQAFSSAARGDPASLDPETASPKKLELGDVLMSCRNSEFKMHKSLGRIPQRTSLNAQV